MRSRTAAWTLALAAASRWMTGCGDETFALGDDSLVASAAESVDQATSESALMIVAVDDAEDGATADDLAAAAVARAAQDYSPASCVSAEQTGPTVTYTLNNCSGPYGLANVSGELVTLFATADGGIQITSTGTNMSVNQATVDVQALGVYTREGDEEQLVVTTQTTGVTRQQRALSRTGSYTVSWTQSDDCLALTGTWSTTVDERNFSTAVGGYERCGDSCPEAGGTITYTNDADGTFTVTYDGDDTANWVSTRGGAGQMELVCTP